ncbi:H-NS family nucleoid-associated regulatory protein [Massilia sp. TSP1-1-2]|uniref:H-NS histone family protein n=1 Tax=Massilia sp. TSP1-1-2 TaxID=2804649 RepID=UPI003CF5B6EB
MNTPDISHLSLPELKELKSAVAKLIETRNAEAVNHARTEILALAKRVGMDLKDLLGKTPRTDMGKVAIKYRDPENASNEWTGRGRSPHWAAAMKDAGTLDSARV